MRTGNACRVLRELPLCHPPCQLLSYHHCLILQTGYYTSPRLLPPHSNLLLNGWPMDIDDVRCKRVRDVLFWVPLELHYVTGFRTLPADILSGVRNRLFSIGCKVMTFPTAAYARDTTVRQITGVIPW